jgi:hypothetical protein
MYGGRNRPPQEETELTLQTDRQFRVAGCWALASDGVQWVLQYRATKRWQAVKFIRSTKDHLACRLGELEVPSCDAERLLEGLPDSFGVVGGPRAAARGPP